MSEFAIARHGPDDYRLLMWDGSTETEVAGPNVSVTGWSDTPTLRDCATALMDHHGTGSSPFGSHEGTLDSLELANQWPLPTRDMTLDGETIPWNDE